MLPRALLLLLIFFGLASTRPNIVGWYDGRDEFVKAVPPTSLDFKTLTHLVHDNGDIALLENGTVTCNPNKRDALGKQLFKLASANSVIIQWSLSDNTAPLVSDIKKQLAFVSSAPNALRACGYGGVEFDWEGPKTGAAADNYTDMLVALKASATSNSTSNTGFAVSADIAAWTSYPYITPSKMGSKESGIDFVNLMSYFFASNGSLAKYDAAIKTCLGWGFERDRLNIGIPFYDRFARHIRHTPKPSILRKMKK